MVTALDPKALRLNPQEAAELHGTAPQDCTRAQRVMPRILLNGLGLSNKESRMTEAADVRVWALKQSKAELTRI